ncbi:MAG: hypothetical protein R3C28_18800 [Pirellulaceae bacterium]
MSGSVSRFLAVTSARSVSAMHRDGVGKSSLAITSIMETSLLLVDGGAGRIRLPSGISLGTLRLGFQTIWPRRQMASTRWFRVSKDEVETRSRRERRDFLVKQH